MSTGSFFFAAAAPLKLCSKGITWQLGAACETVRKACETFIYGDPILQKMGHILQMTLEYLELTFS